MDSIEIPHYFICPISLQIMEDPVTTITGITYDRRSIERWIFVEHNTTCPVTNQPLFPNSSGVTPNHTLRRLIQSWCTTNASRGVDRIPTPRAPLDNRAVLDLLRGLCDPQQQLNSLKTAAALVAESESNRRCMVQHGVAECMAKLIISCCRSNHTDRVELCLTILHSLRLTPDELKPILVANNSDLIDELTWVLLHGSNNNSEMITTTTTTNTAAALVLKSIIEVTSDAVLERLNLDFFKAVSSLIHDRISNQVTKAALHVILHACPWGRNRAKIVESGAMKEVIELELASPDKRTTELDLAILDHLCSCADGRAELIRHAAGIAVVAKRILRASPSADDRAVRILLSICRYSATGEVLQEMVRVGAVSKLCFVMQANCSTSVKEKARWVLRLHSGVWKNSPCIDAYLLTRYP
ncbi:E3 ubiquitin-protein ligase PUB23-like [Typha angustifolia]|uniref:E3 ubiquitin-protein ligase PUB23-like n=1 Tax=Typha angustifolia TaxID=59011 RepID=UPI003C2BAA4B